MNKRLVPLHKTLFVEPNPQPVKGALSVVWEPVGEPRLPLVAAAPETLAAVTSALEGARNA